MITAHVTVDLTKLGRLTRELRPKLEDVVAAAAHNVERGAKDHVPVDTGATKNSIYVAIAGKSSSYDDSASGARSARPGVVLTPEVKPQGDKGLAATIGPSTEYAPELEFGRSRMPARPYLVPALEAERQGFIAAITEIMRGV